MRLFAAIRPPQAVLDHLASALDLLSADRRGRNPWLPQINWHITLAFYGDVPDGLAPEIAQRLAAVARTTGPFQLHLAGAGVFNRDTCWVGLADPSDALTSLAEDLRRDLVRAGQHASHRFHLTVSRSGRRADLAPAMRALAVYTGPDWLVDQIGAYRSDLGQGIGGHPRYSEIASAHLTGDAPSGGGDASR